MDTVVEPLASGPHGLPDEPDSLALDPHGNLCFTVQARNRVYVAVRPGELLQPFPWHTPRWGVVVVVVLAAVIFGVFRLRHRGASILAARGPA